MDKKEFKKWINQDWDHITYEQAVAKYDSIKKISIADIHETIKRYEEDTNYEDA